MGMLFEHPVRFTLSQQAPPCSDMDDHADALRVSCLIQLQQMEALKRVSLKMSHITRRGNVDAL
jgi:hypothetical protein